MKFILISLLSVLPSLAFADQAPSWWQLPDQGKSCTLIARFGAAKGCGSKGYETWNCAVASNDAFTPASSKKYLLTGEYISDAGPNAPCDTYVVKEAIQQN